MTTQRNYCLIIKNFELFELISVFWWEDQKKLSFLPNLKFNLIDHYFMRADLIIKK